MAKKTLVRDQDKFMLRLPDGMRDRIKAKADRAGMSMNEAIVYTLERWFPEPVSIEKKIDELAEMVAILKGDDTYKAVDGLIAEVHDTLQKLSSGKIGALPDFKETVRDRYERWQEEENERQRDLYENPFDDDLYPDDPFPEPPKKVGD
jgi:hypothetical protein